MKKKQGAALIWVLMVFTVLIITGTAVMVLITNATQITGNSNVQSNLRIEAYTGVNLGEYYLVNEENYKKLTETNKQIILNQKGVIDIANNLQDDTLIEGIEKYNLNLEFKKISKDKYEIVSIANLNGQSYKQSKEITIKESESTDINKEIDNFLDNIAGIAILDKGTGVKDLNIERKNIIQEDSTWNLVLNNIGINIKGIKNINEISNELNNSKVNLTISPTCKISNSHNGEDSTGLRLKFKNKKLNVDANYLSSLSSIPANPGDVMLINGQLNGNNVKLENESKLTQKQIENSNGILVYLGGFIPSQQWALINNGDITISSKFNVSPVINNMLIYSTGKIILNGTLQNQMFYIQYSALVANKGITFKDVGFQLSYELDLTEKTWLKNVLKKIVK